MTNKTIARKRKAIAARLNKVGSASLGASLLIGGSPALANSAAFSQVSGGGAFNSLQHHALPTANLNHAQSAATQNSGHLPGSTFSNFNSAHLHNANQQTTLAPGWQQSGVTATTVPTAQKLSIGGGNLDLQSATANVVLGTGMFNGASSATITVGGASQIFHPGQKATAAEYIALTEVLNSGSQTLTLNNAGVAVGGDFTLNSAAITKAASIVIPANVVALDNIAAASSFSIKGDLLNYGSLSAYSNSASATSGTITAKDIVNESGGLINTQSSASHVDLTLVATDNFTNAGVVTSSGSLNLVSGSGNFANSGLVQSTGGSINFATINSNTDINVISSGKGSFQAQTGDINIRNVSYAGSGNVNLLGGDYLSQNLNVYSGTGAINGSVGQVTGQLNTQAGAEHLNANTSNLVLGQNTVDGDPTFVNDGDITISGVNTFTEDVAIIANGNIVSTNGAQIVDHGHNVILLAGVQTDGAPSTGTVQNGTTGTSVSSTGDFSSASNKGGDINFAVGAANTPIDTSGVNTNGGNVTLAAFANGSTGGNIRFDGASTINTSTSANNNVGGNGGNVTVIAGGVGGVVQTINLGNITTSGGGVAGSNSAGTGGSITIATAQPGVAAGSMITFTDTGYSSTAIVPTTAVSGANINIGGKLNTSYSSSTINLGVTGGAVNISAGGSIYVGAIQTSGGNGNNITNNISQSGGAGGAGGAVTLQANGGSLIVNGGINASGGVGGNSISAMDGAAGGAGGTVIASSTDSMSLGNINISGGNGGNAGAITGFSRQALSGGAGGAGGGTGVLSLTTQGPSITLANIIATGGNGGNGGGGSLADFPGNGGNGGAGGAGAAVTISTSNSNNDSFGNISASGGSGGQGGTAGAGEQTGQSTTVPGANGGNGGNGGGGGSIVITSPNAGINASSSLTYAAAGGAGGTGGTGGNGSAAGAQVTFASGNGGNGGVGGNAGSITETAINFTNNFALLGGAAGTSGAAGAVGTPLGITGIAGTIGTNGNLNITGSGTVATAITAGNISITAPTGSNGSVTVSAALTADNNLTLASDGTGSLTVNSVPLKATNFSLTNTTGDITAPLTFATTAGGNVTLAAPNGAIIENFQVPVTALGIVASGAVTLSPTRIFVASGSSISGSSVTINAQSSSDLYVYLNSQTSTITATSGDVKITGATGNYVGINNSGVISAAAGNINITASASNNNKGVMAAISGGGTMQVGATGTTTITASSGTGNPALAYNTVYFAGSQSFIGTTVVNATGFGGEVTLAGGPTTDTGKLTFNTPYLSIVLGSTITASPFVLNSGTGAGVIASTGNLDLSSLGSLTFAGANLAILASGSITDSGKTVNISTANTNGGGGNVTIIGGFTFTSVPFAGPNYPNIDTADTFTLTGTNTAATSINLAHTSIDTSGTTSGGNISVYGVGSVSLGAVTSKGTDKAGNVIVYGNSINVGGTINASSSAGAAGSVVLSGASAKLSSTDPVFISDGFVYGGSITGSPVTGNVLTHSITADGTVGGGRIQILSGGATTFNVGSTAKTNVNGVVGTLSASGPGGSLLIDSFQSGITNATPLNNFQSVSESTVGAGSISLGSSLSKNPQLTYASFDVNNGLLTETGTVTATRVIIYSGQSVGTTTTAFNINAATVSASATGVLNIKDANANIKISQFYAGTVGKFVGAGNITTATNVNAGSDVTIQAGTAGSITLGGTVTGAGKTTLIAGGKGSITGLAADIISGTSVVLASTSGAIGTAAVPLSVNTTTLTETSTGATYLANSNSALLTFNGSNTTGAFSLTADAAVTVAKTIAKATSINIETFPTVNTGIVGGILLNAAIGGTATTNIVLATGGTTGAISGTAAITSSKTGSISLTSGSGAIGTGAVGATTAVKVSTGNLTLANTGTGQVNIINSATYAGTVAASSSGGDFDLKTAQSTTLDGIAAGGNLNILVSAGTLTTAKNAVFTTQEGSVLLEEVATSGKIMMNTGTVISTLSTSGTGGNVVVSIGAPPATVIAGTTPTNVTVNNVSGGSAFFGGGITANANGGVNVVNLQGSNVTFNVGKATSKAAAIVLDGDVTITADPVVGAGALVVGGSVANIVAGPVVERVFAPSAKVIASVAPVAAVTYTAGQAIGQDNSAIGQSNLAARAGNLFAEPGWISQTELSSGEIPAAISSSLELGVTSAVSSVLDLEELGESDVAGQRIAGKQTTPLVGGVSQVDASMKVMQLKRGSVVFAPTQNTIVHTPVGDVKIAAHSLVMVMVFDQGVAVYNLHDSHAGAVSLSVAGKELRLTPGAASIVVPNSVRSFAEVNPAQMIGYSNLSERTVGSTYRVYSGQFSLTQAMGTVLPLRQLVSANNVEARRLSAKLLKTSAILQQLSGGRYEQVVRPVKTAWGNQSH